MKKKETTMQITVTRTLKLEEKTCPACRKRFMGPLVKKYCSRECLNRVDYERNAEHRRAHRREVYRKQQETPTKKEKEN